MYGELIGNYKNYAIKSLQDNKLWGKTYDEVLAMYLVSIFFPDIDLAMTAQTKENAAELLKD